MTKSKRKSRGISVKSDPAKHRGLQPEDKEGCIKTCYVVLVDLKYETEYAPKAKKTKMHEISNNSEKSHMISDTEEEPTTAPKSSVVIVTDEDNDDEKNKMDASDPKEGCSGNECYTSASLVEKEYFVSQHNILNKTECNLCKNCHQSLNDPVANQETTDGESPSDDEPIFVSEWLSVNEQKTPVPLEQRTSSMDIEKHENGRTRCKIQECFLLDIENTKLYSGKNFKNNKDELAQKIYRLMNNTVFDGKLPEKMDITWNAKLVQTAGLCITNRTEYGMGKRYAKIQLSQKVCDSADRLRDTLIHEMCHAASWIIDGVRTSHGATWKSYAKKSNTIHPELPKITRSHNYKNNYKIYYECTRCKARVGRFTRSLDTKRSVCALCRGSFVMLPLTRKDGTPVQPYVRPFARYFQENYRLMWKKEGMTTSREIMKKLSKDYIANKQKNALKVTSE